MKITSAVVSDFQSIRNSNRFDIGDITCLVGKNEAGKTAILRALYRLNPIIPAHSNFDVTDDYPRAEVEDYQQDVEAHRRPPATVIEAAFTLDPEELTIIESEFGSGILEKPVLTLSKGYENKIYVQLPVDEKVAVKAIIDSAQLPAALSQEIGSSSNIETLGTLVNSKVDPQSADKINQLKSQLAKINQAKGLTRYIYDKYLQKSTPKFLYFDEYYVMKGQENIETLKTRVSQKNL
ncbi:MAG: hypothetical protein NTX52_05230, partial [Planctomycetota bacterium]|nr:hypothetical protein [Planctomycetota bacterium]